MRCRYSSSSRDALPSMLHGQMLCRLRRSSLPPLAEALPPRAFIGYFAATVVRFVIGGYLAVVLLWWIFCHRRRAGLLGGCVAAEGCLVISLADALPPLLLEACLVCPGWILRHRGFTAPLGSVALFSFVTSSSLSGVSRTWVSVPFLSCFPVFCVFGTALVILGLLACPCNVSNSTSSNTW